MTIATTTTTTTSSSVTADRKVIIPDGVGGAACAAVGAKTARACDYCVRKRARWYCAADDAFLCQLCDGSVHSANPLARRHNRVRLKTASSSTTTTKKKPGDVELSVNIPSWQRGLKRKPRTPRGHRAKQSMWTRAAGGGEKAAAAALWKKRRSLVVPEFGVEDNSASTTSHDEEEEEEDERQLVYRVPVFDPFESELCTSNNSSSAVNNNSNNNDIKSVFTMSGGGDVESGGGVGVGVFMPSDLDLEEFERLLGKGLDGDHRESQNQSCCLYGIEEEEGEMGGGGLLDHCHDIVSNHRNPNTVHHHHNNSNNNARLDCSNYLIKPEEEEEATKFEGGLLVDEDTIEPFELTFDYDDGDYDYPMPPLTTTKGEDRCEIELHAKANGSTTTTEQPPEMVAQVDNKYLKKMVSLKLQDYDAIANAWTAQTAAAGAGSSPWIDGERPSISPDECNWWPHQHYHHPQFLVPGSEHQPNLPFGHHHHQQQQGITGPGNVVVVGGGVGGEGREARVSRYREKRRTRLFSKKIRYEVRKLNAEKRPRVKGRFVKRTGSTATAPPATGPAAPAAAAAKPVRVGRQKVK